MWSKENSIRSSIIVEKYCTNDFRCSTLHVASSGEDADTFYPQNHLYLQSNFNESRGDFKGVTCNSLEKLLTYNIQ